MGEEDLEAFLYGCPMGHLQWALQFMESEIENCRDPECFELLIRLSEETGHGDVVALALMDEMVAAAALWQEKLENAKRGRGCR